MKELFVPYESAETLMLKIFQDFNIEWKDSSVVNWISCSAPLYQQLVDWFRDKHRYHIDITFQESIGNRVEFINTPYYSIEIYHLHEGDAWKTYKFVAFSDDYYKTLTKAIEEAFKLI